MAASGPLRTEEYFTDEGQERAVLASLEAAKDGTAFPTVIVDASGGLVGPLNLNSIMRGAFQSASIGYWVDQQRNGEGIASAEVAAAKRSRSRSSRFTGSRQRPSWTTGHPSGSC